MSQENEEMEVKNEDGTTDEETTDDTEDTDSDSSQSDEEDTDESQDGEEDSEETTADTKATIDDLKEVENETPREKALRMELTRVKRLNRQSQTQEILKDRPIIVEKSAATSAATEILKKYKPEEINSLREVLPALAEEMGFVRKDELSKNSYAEKAQEQIDAFIEAHPEYAIENDKNTVLWNRLRTEYNEYYKQPANPKDLRKIFERIHTDIMGIKAATTNLQKVTAAKEKVKVASHSGSSVQTQRNGVKSAIPTNLRTDALKGFTDQEIADIEARSAR